MNLKTLLRHKEEDGQALVLIALTLVVLFGISALVLDVGRAYVVKRHLQASADAAALAGAQELPDPSAATSFAQSYSGNPGAKNADNHLPPVSTTVTTKCLSKTTCNPVNALVVEETTFVPTLFAKVLGINGFTIKARATALMGQGVPKPAHIMIVLDRTNSMNSSCSAGGTKMTCARNGIKAFLSGMDPKYDDVGLMVLPPGNGGAPCSFTPKSTDGPTTEYDAYPNGYLVVTLGHDYRANNTAPLNTSSALVSTVNCVTAGGTTAQAPAIDKAQAYLAAHHDAKAQDVIILLTDGEGVYGPCTDANHDQVCENNSSPYRSQPCHQAITSAHAATAAGTIVYGIAYNASGLTCQGWKSSGTGSDGQSCNKKNGYQFRCNESPSMSATTMVQGVASDSTKYFNQPNPADLTTTFQHIAEDLTGPSLVDDSYTG
jgi:Flp pilus assembly protein TadG